MMQGRKWHSSASATRRLLITLGLKGLLQLSGRLSVTEKMFLTPSQHHWMTVKFFHINLPWSNCFNHVTKVQKISIGSFYSYNKCYCLYVLGIPPICLFIEMDFLRNSKNRHPKMQSNLLCILTQIAKIMIRILYIFHLELFETLTKIHVIKREREKGV